MPRTDRELSSLVESWQKLASSPHPRRGAGKGSLQERGRSSRVILGWSRRTIWGGGGRRGCPPSSPGCRSSRLRSAPLTSLFLLLLPASHTTLSQLPSDLSGAKVWSQSAGAGRPRPQGAHRAFSPSFSSFLERREPPRNPPGGQTEPVKTPADKLASPSIAPFRSGQVSLRPVTALPHQPGSPGSPAGSRFARLRLAPREGLPLCRVPAREPAPPPPDFGEEHLAKRVTRRPLAPPGSPPHCCFRSSTGGDLSLKSISSLLHPSAQSDPVQRGRQTGTEIVLPLF